MVEPDDARSKDKMGLYQCTAYVIGNIIGSGIFITPGGVLAQTGSVGLSLLVWVGCGIISLLGAVCYIELGTSIPDPGCDFAYACFVGWDIIAFAFMLVSVLVTFPASAAVQAQTLGQYMIEGLSISIDPSWQSTASRSIGFLCLFILSFANFYPISKIAARIQTVNTAAKVLSMLPIIGAGFYFLVFQGKTEYVSQPFAGSIWDPGMLGLAFYGGLWSYAGWEVLNYGTPEIDKPRRTMPLALFSGITIVTVIYAFINFAYFVVLPAKQIKTSNAVAADFAEVAFGSFRFLIPFMIVILLLGTLNTNLFVGSRSMQAAAQRGHLPPFISCIQKIHGSPRVAILLQALLTVAVSFFDIDTLINYVTFVMWAQRVVTMSALLWIRYRKIPVDTGAIRMPLPLSLIFTVISIALVLVPFYQNPEVCFIGSLCIFGSAALFYPFIYWKVPVLPQINETITTMTERLFNSKRDLWNPRIVGSIVESNVSQVAREAETEPLQSQ